MAVNRDVRQDANPRWVWIALVTTLLGTFVGVLGPFGSYLNQGVLVRIAYWICCFWSGLLFFGSGMILATRFTPAAAPSWQRWAALVVSVFVASVPQTILTRTVAFVVWPELRQPELGWSLWYVQVVTIGMAMVVGMSLVRGRAGATTPPRQYPVPDTDVTRTSPLNALGADVIALQMEDHYVRVHTCSGSVLVLMPMALAIKGVGAIEGLRTHRSWWVARRAVARLEGTPRSMKLHLTNGLIAPVARTAVAELRAAGWMDSDA